MSLTSSPHFYCEILAFASIIKLVSFQCGCSFFFLCVSSLAISVEGLPRTTIINVGQHILIEGDDEDNPYVAKVIRLFGDGESRKMVESKFELHLSVISKGGGIPNE